MWLIVVTQAFSEYGLLSYSDISVCSLCFLRHCRLLRSIFRMGLRLETGVRSWGVAVRRRGFFDVVDCGYTSVFGIWAFKL